MARRSTDLRRQAAAAVALVVVFHVVVVGLGAVLVAAPILQIVYFQRLHVATIMIAGFGISLLRALLPRRTPFVVPGPRVDAASQPELLALVEQVATRVGEPMPAAVYLIDDVNAFVTKVGGRAGVGGHRVLAVGVPLMRVLEPEELEAVIAHEFGHFTGGDLRLAPLLYQMRASLGRTIGAVDHTWLRRPFLMYAEAYLSVTQGLSRAQEHAADQLSAQVTSPQVAASALARLPQASVAFAVYREREYGPVVSVGYRPPFLEGFDSFLRSDTVGRASTEHADVAMGSTAHSRFDSHPPVAERIAALGVDVSAFLGRPVTSRPSIDLLRDLDAVDQALEELRFGPHLADHQPMSWDSIAEKIILPAWLETVVDMAPELGDLTPATVPLTRDGQAELADRLHDPDQGQLLRLQREALGQRVTTHFLGAATVAAGFHIESLPGEEIRFRKGDQVLDLFREHGRVIDGEADPAAWPAFVARWGIEISVEQLARLAPASTARPAPVAAFVPFDAEPGERPPPPADAPYAYRGVPPGQGALRHSLPLAVDRDSLRWGDTTLRPDEITHVALTTYPDGKGARFSCRMVGPGSEVSIELAGHERNQEEWRRATAAVDAWFTMFVEPRLVDDRLEVLAAHGRVEVAGATICRDGIVDGARVVPWSDVTGVSSNGKELWIWEAADNLDGAKILHTSSATDLDTVLIPLLVDAARAMSTR